MESLLSVDWRELFEFSMPPAELIVRGSAMYWFLFLVFRFIIRRDVGSVGIADVLVLVIVADASQNALAGEYTSVSDGMVLVATLIFWNVLLDWASFRFPRLSRVAEPRPLELVENGRLLRRNMRREFITEEEVWSQLRQAGIDSLDEVKRMYIEPDGQISVIRHRR